MLKLSFRYMKADKKGSIRAILGMTLSIMFMFSLVQIGGSFLNYYRQMVGNGNHQDFIIYNTEPSDLIRAYDGIQSNKLTKEQKMLLVISAGYYLYHHDSSYEYCSIAGMEGDFSYFSNTKLSEGHLPVKDGEACVTEEFAKNNGNLKVGDRFQIEVFAYEENDYITVNEAESFVVCGLMKGTVAGSDKIVLSASYAEKKNKEYSITDLTENKLLYEMVPGEYNEEKLFEAQECFGALICSAENGILTYQQVAEEFQESIQNGTEFVKKKSFINCVLKNDVKSEQYGEKGVFTSLSITFVFIAGLICVCMCVFVYNTLYLNLLHKLTDLSVMRSIGLNRRQLLWMLLTESLFFSFSALFFGFLFGNLLNYLFAEKIIGLLLSTMEYTVTLSQSLRDYIITFLLVVGAGLFAGILLYLRIRKKNPVEISALGQNRKRKRKEQKGYRKGHLLLKIAERNEKRNAAKSRTQMITVALSSFLCFVILNTFFVIKPKSTTTIYDLGEKRIDFLLTRIDSETLFSLQEKFQPQTVYTETEIQAVTIRQNQEERLFSVLICCDEVQKLIEKNLDRKSGKYGKEFALLVDENAEGCTELTVMNGEKTELVKLNAVKKETGPELLILSQSFVEPLLIINRTLAKRLSFPYEEYSTVVFHNAQNFSEEELKKKLDDSTYFFVVDSLEDEIANAEKQLLGMEMIAGYIMIATLSLSLLIQGNTIRENIVSRKKEIGVMRALGMSVKDMCKAACFENLSINGKACILGMLLSIFVNSWLTLMNREKILISPISYGLVLVILILGTVLLSYRVMKKNLAKSVVGMIHEE